ncbi:hypothetical protein HanXRQr2_Chr04g0155311 [Helianthus annuus]|uniref:Uncharacterized protein n=1 Tax=Helianthus annuus TaxID=4232 RepID=A0A9K3J5P1_HELAN|nr:hypothetical protein HanXRQr2_Chr04g0155311 [Helianthus annuus]KAJ0930436.1 hypothetical protein HanPSC8_Chr04g0149321 [Helianthus annuus]
MSPEKEAGPPEKEAAAVADVAGHFCRDFRAGIADIMSLIRRLEEVGRRRRVRSEVRVEALVHLLDT